MERVTTQQLVFKIVQGLIEKGLKAIVLKLKMSN